MRGRWCNFHERLVPLNFRYLWWSVLLLSSTCAATTPAPLSVPVGTRWYGDDGNWSPVNIRVGSPPQWVSVFPNTASQETWLVGPGGCDSTLTCRDKRGGLFFANSSTTWSNLGFYALGFDPQLGYSGYADYGIDNIDLSDQIIVPGQIVGLINSTDYWLGYLGLGVESTNFTNANQLTFLSSLVENQSLVPSHSYGYTAGAYYRLKNVPASLTFGGVDTNRFVPNGGVSFALGPNQPPIVAVNSITVSAEPLSTSHSKPTWSANSLTLLGSGDANLFTIDSSTPFLWLPETVCDAFAQGLGLTYNDTLRLYTFGTNTSAHDTLVNWNMTFTFTIANLPGSSKSVDITLPYAAFDLQLSYPFPNLAANFSSAPFNYFPLRRAANNTQYTIGRSFLQESYLIVDYERNNFSISQAQFALDALTNTNLVEITRPYNSNFTGPGGSSSSRSGLSTGAKAGVGVGAAIIAILTIILIIYFIRRSKKHHYEPAQLPPKSPRKSKFFKKFLGSSSEVPPTELLGDKHQPAEVPADVDNTRFELPGPAPVELPGSEVGATYYGQDAHKHGHGTYLSAYDAHQRKLDQPQAPPAELEHRNSTAKTLNGPGNGNQYSPGQPSPTSLPAYSPSRVGRSGSHNASPQPSPAIENVSPQKVSRTSSQLTSPMFSPLTPPTTTTMLPSGPVGSGGHGSQRESRTTGPSPVLPYVTPNEGGRSSNVSSRLGTPQPPPSRSLSRGSRFVEEGISNEPGDLRQGLVQQPRPQRPQASRQEEQERRFSWED